jgi:hypothetical protein
MFLYEIKQGRLWKDDDLIAIGLYSGDFEHRNDPGATRLHNQGPLPMGVYRIGTPRDTDRHGPYFIPLDPVPGSETWGRGGFGIHGERLPPAEPGHASEGCIIAPPGPRREVGSHVGALLVVVSGLRGGGQDVA